MQMQSFSAQFRVSSVSICDDAREESDIILDLELAVRLGQRKVAPCGGGLKACCFCLA